VKFKGTGLVAFIDLLGFSAAIEQTWDQSPSALDMVIDLKQQLQRPFGLRLDNKDRPDLTQRPSVSSISDSIVLKYAMHSGDATEVFHGFAQIYGAVLLIAKYAAERDFAIRGGLELGPVAWDEDHDPIGPAFITAYTLESKLAVNVRTILGPNLLRRFADDDYKDQMPPDRLVTLDHDGMVALRPTVEIVEKMRELRSKAPDARRAAKYDYVLKPRPVPVGLPQEVWLRLADNVEGIGPASEG